MKNRSAVLAAALRPWLEPAFLRKVMVLYMAVLLGALAYGRIRLPGISFGKHPENLLWFPALLAVLAWRGTPWRSRKRIPAAVLTLAALSLLSGLGLALVLLPGSPDPRDIGADIGRRLLPAILVLLPAAGFLLMKQRTPEDGDLRLIGLLLYATWLTFAALWSYDYEETFEAIGEAWPAVTFVFLILYGVRNERDLRRLVGVFLAGAATLTVVSVGCWTRNASFPLHASWVQKNTFADFLLIPTGLSLGLLAVSRTRARFALSLTLCALFGFTIAITQSRGGLTGAVVGFVAAGLLFCPRRFFVASATVLALGLAAVIALPGGFVEVPIVQRLMHSISAPGFTGRERRRFHWPAALELFRRRPLTGWGPGAHRTYTDHAALGHHEIVLRDTTPLNGRVIGVLAEESPDEIVVDVTWAALVVRVDWLVNTHGRTAVLKNGSRLQFVQFGHQKLPGRDRFEFMVAGGRLRLPRRFVSTLSHSGLLHVHNEFLQMLVSLGAVGGLFYIGFWISAGHLAWANVRRYRTGIAGAVAFATAFWAAGHLSHAMFDHFYERSRYNMAVAFLWAVALWLYRKPADAGFQRSEGRAQTSGKKGESTESKE